MSIITLSPNRYYRYILFLLFLIILFFTIPSLHSPSSRTISSEIPTDVCGLEESSDSCTDDSSTTESELELELDGIQIDLGSVVSNIQESVERSGKKYDEDWYRNELGFKIRYEDLGQYRSILKGIWKRYFSNDIEENHRGNKLDDILRYTNFIRSRSGVAGRQENAIPKDIYTTSMEDPDKLPDQFDSWTKENKDHNVRFVDDNGIDDWLEEALSPASGVGKEMKWLKDEGRWGVVRSDLFRYLVLLLNGGIYTDTDTACIRPISEWGKNPIKYQSDNPLIEALPQLSSLSSSSTHERYPISVEADDAPSLIVALEVDSPASNTDWRSETFVRGIQIVQWTIASKKGHPILLDVIGHALEKVRELREAEERGWEVDDEQDILEWSGPGAFTDAVFRYLLIRYGFHPKSVSGYDKPLRVGDVLIMPVYSFRADASEGYQGDEKVVWHGFFGRWKPT
ncbi:hypothetical protein L486_07482 [Kwoniella mangroviensis CBS 10435]|uniref:Alpha-1,6-mannosyltransferase n=1 Tax=Kwoniella mangroviensis CBS 10435 TaxID=1331196 RepID=A0A1B9IHB2_9TREE|nr:hypothetical protein L486_07482 [Kwoniella mangroviensis CBS 10435]